MGKYEDLYGIVFKRFEGWNEVAVYPQDYAASKAEEFVRVSAIVSTPGATEKEAKGQLIIEIYTINGLGPRRATIIAGKLDDLFSYKAMGSENGVMQFNVSTMVFLSVDKDLPALQRHLYTANFNYYGN